MFSETIQQTLITGGVAIFLGYMQHRTKVALEQIIATNSSTDSKLDDIHTLVNANMGAQLKIGAIALRRVAELSKAAGDPSYVDDVAAAELAEKNLQEHDRKQHAVDSKEKEN